MYRTIPAVVLLSIFLALPVRAQPRDEDPPRTVAVSGQGEVTVQPDMATLRFGIVTEADDPETAREQNAEAASQAMNAVRELGVPEENIQLETLRLHPRYDYDPETRERELAGYEAVRQVVVEVDSLDLLPLLVARVVERGANRLEGLQYDLRERDPVRNEALREALLNARQKAQLMAETLDLNLGRVHSISEQSFDFPRPMMRMEAFAVADQAAGAAPAPDAFAAGEIEVTASVQVVFELE